MQTQKIIDFFFEIACLRRVIRSHSQYMNGINDSVADHSFRVAMIGLILAALEGCDQNKVLKMCLFHDVEESRTGDANHLNKVYVSMKKEEAIHDILEYLPIEGEMRAIMVEYEERQSKESIVAKDADLIDQLLLHQEYFRGDETNKNVWDESCKKKLQTESAKQLAENISTANPLDWMYHAVDGKKHELPRIS